MSYNISNKSFKYIESEDDYYTIELNEGYPGVKYKYGNVSMKVEEKDGEEYGVLSFSYDIIEGNKELEENDDFQNYIGEVLSFIMIEAFDTNKYRIGAEDESTVATDNHTEKPAQ